MDPELVEEITGKRCFNWGLPSASAETMLAVLRLAVEECEAPIELVIVGIEPVAFHPSLWVHPQARLVPAYTKYFAEAPQMVSLEEKLSRLLTFEQTRTSYMVLRRETGIDEPQKRVEYRDDGRAVYYQREEAIAAGTFDLEETLRARVPYYPEESLGLSTFSGLSQARKRSWEEFLGICVERGVRICVFLSPVHPELWSLLEREGAEPIHNEVAGYVSVTVSEAGGVFRDYRLVESFGGDPDLFYDEVHMQPGNVEILLRDLLADDGSQAGEDR